MCVGGLEASPPEASPLCPPLVPATSTELLEPPFPSLLPPETPSVCSPAALPAAPAAACICTPPCDATSPLTLPAATAPTLRCCAHAASRSSDWRIVSRRMGSRFLTTACSLRTTAFSTASTSAGMPTPPVRAGARRSPCEAAAAAPAACGATPCCAIMYVTPPGPIWLMRPDACDTSRACCATALVTIACEMTCACDRLRAADALLLAALGDTREREPPLPLLCPMAPPASPPPCAASRAERALALEAAR
mmetsp:Transcript_2245/g.6685  ORF Transcript_2245/g.6685 Transcript_2245/m.6685 type:complete len:251 (-) Transcript_2245:582-1334(-)